LRGSFANAGWPDEQEALSVAEELFFETDAAIIARLGQELVAKQETALIELVKNSYDADATEVEVILQSPAPSKKALLIKDNGVGMSRQELIDGFLRLASDMKIRIPRSKLYDRERAGRKGIGRFATHRLGDRLTLRTWTDDNSKGHELSVDWRRFTSGKALSAVAVQVREIEPGERGTTILIEDLRDDWSDEQIRRCWRGVLALQQPFPVAPVEAGPKGDPGFEVRFLKEDALFRDETLVADFQTEILDHLHAVIELIVDEDGVAEWRIVKNKLGSDRPWQKIHHDHRDAKDPPAYRHLRNVWMTAHYVILHPELLPSLVFTRVRDVLSDEGGIRLYRNGFRVVPYGDPEDDWLRLDEIYAKRSLLAPLANRNFFGVIEVHDRSGTMFEEHTSREGLIETPAFLELRDLASAVLVSAATRISEDRGRKTRAGTTRPSAPPQFTDVDEIRRAAEAAAAAAAAAATAAGTGTDGTAGPAAQEAADRFGEAARLIAEKTEQLAAAEARLADEASMLRFLATLGMTTAEFSHETGMTFEAFRLDFDAVFKAAAEVAAKDTGFQDRSDRARGMLERLDTLTSYLNSLAAARSAREMRPVSVKALIKRFEKGVGAQAETQHIQLNIEVPPLDPLYTRPLHEAELASVLLNFYTNAVKAMKRAKGDRSLLIVAEREDGKISIKFSDTGDGIADDIREKIFDPFFTTRIAPPAGAGDLEHAGGTGLGLWIVSQIAENAGGKVAVVDAPQGYSTCFEMTVPADEDSNV
jgi:signal transduction histidine kinase